MAVNEIKIKETDPFLYNGVMFKHEPGKRSIQESGRKATSTYFHGGMVTKDDYTDNLVTINESISFASQAQYEIMQKGVGVPASIKIGSTVYSNAVLQELPAVNLQEPVALVFKAPKKSSL